MMVKNWVFSKTWNLWSLVAFWLLIISPSFLAAVEPKVSNRAPASGEVDYSPKDGSISKVTPPGFVWLPEEGAVSYLLQCSSDPDFSTVEYAITNIPLNVHCPAAVLKPGTWYWRYAYLDQDGNQSEWSKQRKFIVTEKATVFPQPSLPDLIKRIPETHPKLFLRPEQLEEYKGVVKEHFSDYWINFNAYADELMKSPLAVDEPPPYPSGGLRTREKADIDVWRANRGITVKAVTHASNLAFAYLLTGEEKYGKRSIEWMMGVMAWDPVGSTGRKMNDECAMPIVSELSRAYTWIYPLLSDEQKSKIIEVMRIRGNDFYHHLLVTSKHTVYPFNSHNNRLWHFMGEAAIAFIKDIPEAKAWLQYSMDIFFSVYPAWSDDDGGWHEGVAYWKSYMERIYWWLYTMGVSLGIDGYKKPFFQNVGDFPFYVNPPHSEFAGFGDSSDSYSWKSSKSLMKAFALETKNPYWLWYAVQDEEFSIPEKPKYQDLLMASGIDFKPIVPIDLPLSKVFHGVGIASLHSDLGLPRQDVHVLVKSSPFGTQSHGFNAQNSFMLIKNGKPLLHWSGHRDWHGSPHHTEWMWETRSDNSITVNGEGQKKHSSTATGKIIGEYLSKDLDYVAGDATEAYDGNLTKFIRHVFFLKPDIICLIDELEAPEPVTYEFHLHASVPFLVEEQKNIKVKNESSVRITMMAPADLILSQTSEIQPPSVGFDKEQWHFTAQTPEKAEKQYFVTFMQVDNERGEHVPLYADEIHEEEFDAYGFMVDFSKRVGIVINNNNIENLEAQHLKTDAKILFMLDESQGIRAPDILAVDASYLEAEGKRVVESPNKTIHFVSREKLGFTAD